MSLRVTDSMDHCDKISPKLHIIKLFSHTTHTDKIFRGIGFSHVVKITICSMQSLTWDKKFVHVGENFTHESMGRIR